MPWALVGALAVALVILVMLVRYARRVLAEREAASQAAPAGDDAKSPEVHP